MASLSFASTDTSITATVSGLDTTHAYTRYYEWYLDGRYISQNSSAPYAGSASYIFNNLSAGTSYTIKVEIYHTDWTLMATVEDDYSTSGGSGGGGGGGGEDTPTSWSQYNYGSLGTLGSGEVWNSSIYLEPGEVDRMYVTFTYDGTATFETQGDVDTYCYLSTSSSFNSSSGSPSNAISEDDDSGDGNNSLITYGVTAGTRYYFWVRAYDISSDGTVTINVRAPSKTGNGTGFIIYHNNSWCNAVPYIYHNGAWCKTASNLYHGGWNSAI